MHCVFYSPVQSTVISHPVRGENLIVVDNTNVKRWEMVHYYQLAERYRYAVLLVEPRTPWRDDAKVKREKTLRGGELVTICARPLLHAGGGGQRTFTYEGVGLLTKELNRHKGQCSGSVLYSLSTDPGLKYEYRYRY